VLIGSFLFCVLVAAFIIFYLFHKVRAGHFRVDESEQKFDDESEQLLYGENIQPNPIYSDFEMTMLNY